MMLDSTAAPPVWRSVDTANTAFYVKISSITFLKKGTTLGVPVKTYVMTGTCNALLSNGTTTSVMSGGEFNMVISRQNW